MSEGNISEERKGLTEKELKNLRACFKRRQNKFSTITAISAPSDTHDEEEMFEKVDVEISPINMERNKGSCLLIKKVNEATLQKRKKGTLLNKSMISQLRDGNISGSEDAFSLPSCSNSSSKLKEVIRSTSTSSTADSINKSKVSLASITPKKTKELRKSSGTISSPESKTDKAKNIESRPKIIKSEVKKKGTRERKKQDKRKKKKDEKEKDLEKFKINKEKMKVVKNYKKKVDIKDMKKKKGLVREMRKSKEKKQEEKVLRATVKEKQLALGSEKLVTALEKRELKSETSKFSSEEPRIKLESLPANVSSEGYPQSTLNINLLLKPIEMTKKDQSLFEKMDDEIVLDTNLLQSLATDLVTESNKVNKDVIGQVFPNISLT
uniref:Uncharacterized protein n=1 Tax=Elaeophora elaphi TaxID=1147741 RepID=A0A0R3RZ46_9BILA